MEDTSMALVEKKVEEKKSGRKKVRLPATSQTSGCTAEVLRRSDTRKKKSAKKKSEKKIEKWKKNSKDHFDPGFGQLSQKETRIRSRNGQPTKIGRLMDGRKKPLWSPGSPY
jgi:hypothetical protein